MSNSLTRDAELFAKEGARTLDWLVGDRVSLERAVMHRVFHEYCQVAGDDVEQVWWQPIADAAASLGFRPSILDCTIDQVTRLVDNGADVVLYVPESTDNERPGWTAIRGRRKRGFVVWHARGDEENRIRRLKKLKSKIATTVNAETVRCVAFDWRDLISHDLHSTAASTRPIHRLRHLLRPEWSDIWLVLVFAFAVGLFTLVTPLAVESLVNTVAFGRFLQPILVLSLIVLSFLGLSAAIRALQTYVVEIIQQRLFARVAADLANRLPRVCTEGYDSRYMPELVNRFFDVVTVQKVSAMLLLDGVGLVTSAFIGMAVLAFYHPWMFGFDLLLLAAIAFVIIVLGRGAVKTAIIESKSKYYMAAWLEDVARCNVTFRSAAGKSFSSSRSDRLIHDYLIARRSHFRVLLRQIIFSLGLQAVASTLLLGLGGYLVVAGELTLGQLVAAELIVTVIVGAFAKMGKHFESFYDLLASVDKLGALFDLPPEQGGGILSAADDGASTISFRDVTCGRQGSKSPFAPISLEVPAGASLAIYGPAGSGKSTLLDLIYGLRRPGSGRLEVDGRQPCDLHNDDYRSHVELVRDGETFAGTIEENVHLHRPDISDNDVREALQAVGMLETVSLLPKAIATKIASHGAPLTSNQIRLLLLARAISASPTIILVDGLLDALPDQELQQAIEGLTDPSGSWTLVVATGRADIARRFQHQIVLPDSQTVLN
ncbi:MAG: ABC transporter ATP-binding protein [Pirellulaceae bacterium]